MKYQMASGYTTISFDGPNFYVGAIKCNTLCN